MDSSGDAFCLVMILALKAFTWHTLCVSEVP